MGDQVIQLRRRRPRTDQELLHVGGPGGAAERLGVDESTVRRWIRQGLVPHVRLGAGGPHAPIRIPADALEEWWRKRQEGGRL